MCKLSLMGHVSGSMEDGKNQATTILITPVWKDSARLKAFGQELAVELAFRNSEVEWIIADDGSGPEERKALEGLGAEFAKIYPKVRVHYAEEHRGKGSVVREGWALEPEAAWYAFVDADGSVSAVEMLNLVETAQQSGNSTLAIRKNTDTTKVDEDFFRKLRHYGFLTACHLIIGVKSEDTQCGAKVLKGSDYRTIAGNLREVGLAFDAELLAELAAAGFRWDEVPVNWSRVGGSRVHPWSDATDMLAALFRIRGRLGNASRSHNSG
ncbi:glycosyltransferase [Haloferula sp.]|uniref:glycosyltransferase n=1 Tax=Haloferula sp. TaxID=2497595 RepID=UPI00329FBE95